MARDVSDRRFMRDPRLRALISSDLSRQRMAPVRAIAAAVAGLDRLDALVLPVADLGRRHLGSGGEARHHPIVGAALLDTLRARLGAGFTPELEGAWRTAYGLLDAMRAGAVPRPQSVGGSART